MKYVIAFLFCIITSCNSQQKASIEANKMIVETKCPEDGLCTFEIRTKKSLYIEESSLGEMYPKISDGEKLVLKFDYKKKEIPDVQDSSYNEIIYLEIDPDNPEVNLKDSELEKVKLTFARFCYCKGQTGYYKIKEGNLSIKKTSKNNFNLALTFNINEVPQIINSINETFVLD